MRRSSWSTDGRPGGSKTKDALPLPGVPPTPAHKGGTGLRSPFLLATPPSASPGRSSRDPRGILEAPPATMVSSPTEQSPPRASPRRPGDGAPAGPCVARSTSCPAWRRGEVRGVQAPAIESRFSRWETTHWRSSGPSCSPGRRWGPARTPSPPATEGGASPSDLRQPTDPGAGLSKGGAFRTHLRRIPP